MTSTKRGNKKQPTDASEEDFEAFVRESLARLCGGQEKIIQDISNLKAKVQLNKLNLEPKLENAHRAGPRSDSKPRAIICKFVYGPERYKVIRKKRDLKDGV